MEQKTLNAIERKDLKKGANGRLRRTGKIPAIVYGNTETTAVAIDEHEFMTKFRTISENIIINLTLGSRTQDVLVKDYQEDLLSGKIVHIDFFAIDKDKILKARVPFKFSGSAKGVRDGGILELQLHELVVECLPKDLPAEIVVDITELDANHAIHVRDLAALQGVKIINSPEQVIANITHAKAEVVPVAAAAAEEVEGEEKKAEAPAAGAAAPAAGAAAPAAAKG